MKNPANDAATWLRAQGAWFQGHVRTDASQRQMKQALRECAQDLRRGGVGLVLLRRARRAEQRQEFPHTDRANVETEAELEDESRDANLVLSYMDEAKPGEHRRCSMLCRNNPFARRFRSAPAGLRQDGPAPRAVLSRSPLHRGRSPRWRWPQRRIHGAPAGHLRRRMGTSTRCSGRVAPRFDGQGRQAGAVVASSLTGDFYFRIPATRDDTKLKQTEQERAALAQALEDERRAARAGERRRQGTVREERGSLRKNWRKHANAREGMRNWYVRKSRTARGIAEIRAEGPRRCPTVGIMRCEAPATNRSRMPAEKPAQDGGCKPAPSRRPLHLHEGRAAYSRAPSSSMARAPAAARVEGIASGVLENSAANSAMQKQWGFAGIEARDFETLVKYQALLSGMPYQSALALASARGLSACRDECGDN